MRKRAMHWKNVYFKRHCGLQGRHWRTHPASVKPEFGYDNLERIYECYAFDGSVQCWDNWRKENPDNCSVSREGYCRWANGDNISKSFPCEGYTDYGDGRDELDGTDQCAACPEDYYKCKKCCCVWQILLEAVLEMDWFVTVIEKNIQYFDPRIKNLNISFSFMAINDNRDWSDESEEMCPCTDDQNRY